MSCLHVILAPFSLSRPLASPNFRCRPVRCAAERQALFNGIAPVYDYLNDVLSLGQHRIWKRMAVSWSGAKMGDRVLDVCCGSGDLTLLLSEKVGSNGQFGLSIVLFGDMRLDVSSSVLGQHSIDVTGIDFSKQQLLMASSRQNLRLKSCFSNIEWIEGDALDLPFTDGSFDAITMGYGLRNVVDRRKAMQELLRVLKAGSRVSILDFNKSDQFLTASTLEWIIDNVVVPAASGYGLSEEYRYLKTSIREFLTGKELEKLALEVGFSSARHYEINGSFMGCLVAKR